MRHRNFYHYQKLSILIVMKFDYLCLVYIFKNVKTLDFNWISTPIFYFLHNLINNLIVVKSNLYINIMNKVEIICQNCKQDTLLKREPIYDGFNKIGTKFVCATVDLFLKVKKVFCLKFLKIRNQFLIMRIL